MAKSTSSPSRPWTEWEQQACDEWSWFVGLFEGEGSAGVYYYSSPYPFTILAIKMTDLDVLERVQAFLGVGRISPVTTPDGCKPAWTWQVQKRADVLAVATALRPHVNGRRREQLSGVIEDIEEYERCKSDGTLKRRG